MGSYTLYPVAQSGYILSESSNDLAAGARAGTGYAITAFPGGNIVAGEGDYASSYDQIYEVFEGFLSFDTSGVTGSVTAATLSLGLISDNSTTDFTVQARALDWGSTLEAADFVVTGGFGSLTLLATLATAGIGANGYKAMTENGTNLRSAINQSGFTRALIVGDRTANNSTYAYGGIAFDPYNGTTKPKLEITTSGGAAFMPAPAKRLSQAVQRSAVR